MYTSIYFISNVVNWIVNLLALVAALLYCYRSFNPSYLRIFPTYLFVSIMVEILVNSYITNAFDFQPFGGKQHYAKMAFYNLFTPFELFAFSWFLFQVIQSSMIKKALIALLVVFSIFFIQYSLKTDLGKKPNSIAVILESVIIIVPCLTYFRELFAWKEPVDLLKEPSFWLVTGIFFYVATIVPLYVTNNYLAGHGMETVAKSLSSINNFALSISYLLFIKGFTCRIKK